MVYISTAVHRTNSLLKHFAYLANTNLLSSQLESLHQEKDETLSEYAKRARKLLKDKNAAYSDLTKQQSKDHNNQAMRSFSKGISNPSIQKQLKIYNAQTLDDAISFAMQAEHDAKTEIQRSEFFCKYCRINGHREIQCRRKENANSDVGKLAIALRSMGNIFGRSRSDFNSYQRNSYRNNPYRNTFDRNNFFPNNFARNNFNPNNFGLNNNFGRNNFGRNWSPNFNRNQFGPNQNLNNPNYNRNMNNDNFDENRNRYDNGNNNRPFNNIDNFDRNWNRNRNGNGNGNANGNFQPNRNSWQPNQRPRANNFIHRARINAFTTDSSDDDCFTDTFFDYDSTDYDSTDYEFDAEN